MPQGVTFDTASGLDLSGWWSNPRTGESYRVVDQFFQDNVLYVRTDKGRILNYNNIQNCVKSDGPLQGPVSRPPVAQPIPENSKLLEGLEQEDADILTQVVHSRSDVDSSAHIEEKKPEKSVNRMIIEKAFSKANDAPRILLGMEWDWTGFQPTIVMLKDTMDIPTSEIVDYLYSKYSEQMIESIKNTLTEYVDRGGTFACP
jgi:hypothetical protein